MSSSGAEDKPWKLTVKFQTPSFSPLFKIAICERGWVRSLKKIGLLICVGLQDKCCLLGECWELIRQLCGTSYNCTCAAAQHTNVYTKSNSCEWTRVLCVLKVYSCWLRCVSEALYWQPWHVGLGRISYARQQNEGTDFTDVISSVDVLYWTVCYCIHICTLLWQHWHWVTAGRQANTKLSMSNSNGLHFPVFQEMIYKSNVMGKRPHLCRFMSPAERL